MLLSCLPTLFHSVTSSTIPLNDGNQVPWIAFGTGTAFYQQDVQNTVKSSLANGFTHFDCAQMYKNEVSLGVAIRASGVPRPSLFVTTKLGPLQQPGQTAKTALHASLEKLGLEYVDPYLVHVPGDHAGRLKEVWKLEIHPYVCGITCNL
ncbi:oxidoreductase [Suillus clintonianus]|uniref:oxidoreductase n=1 Tax=Suillus clintonianus TaxID=1904413 RepID=UPI001B8714E8|nr:oxidoreductase [Suillus clintonianus]KAG2134088.1 oxidoreductase [Suillus clintonianus]